MIDGIDDDPRLPSGGGGFGGNASGKKCSKGVFHGLLLSNQTHRSTRNSESPLLKKTPDVGAFLSFIEHCVMENRKELVIASEDTDANVSDGRDSALQMARLPMGAHQQTLGWREGLRHQELCCLPANQRHDPHVV
jgi:hypothetical protein